MGDGDLAGGRPHHLLAPSPRPLRRRRLLTTGFSLLKYFHVQQEIFLHIIYVTQFCLGKCHFFPLDASSEETDVTGVASPLCADCHTISPTGQIDHIEGDAKKDFFSAGISNICISVNFNASEMLTENISVLHSSVKCSLTCMASLMAATMFLSCLSRP